MTALISLLTLIIGLLLGFYGRMIYDRLNMLVEIRREEHEAKKVGVVRVTRETVNPNEPIDLSAPGGGVVKRQTPAQAEEQRQIVRDRILRSSHS